MRPDSDAIMSVICAVLEDVNRQLPVAQRLTCGRCTVLVGAGGTLDSLALINFLVLLEEALAERLRAPVTLMREELLGDPVGPFATIGGLADFVAANYSA